MVPFKPAVLSALGFVASFCLPRADCEEPDVPLGRTKCISSFTDVNNRLHLVIEPRLRVPDWWRSSVGAVNNSKELVRLVRKEHESWNYVKQWQCWVPHFCEVRGAPDSFALISDGNVIDVSPAKASLLAPSLFENRLTVSASKKWTVLATCNDHPYEFHIHCIASDSRKIRFSKAFLCYTPDAPQGRHRHLIGVDISEDYAAIYTASYLGCTISIVDLNSGVRCFYSELNNDQNNFMGKAIFEK